MNRSFVPTSKRILVDDADGRISYQGAWEVLQGEEFSGGGNNGPPFRTTLHGIRPQTTGNFLFEYEGSSVEVWGTVPVEDNFDADWECLVDGLPAQRVDVSFNPRSRHRQKLCEWRSNEFGKHILFVNATSRENGRFLVDYISYLPSPSEDALTGIIQVPHDDPDFNFEGARWRIQEGAGRRTRLPGNSARLEFIGTSLEWYGFRTGNFPSNQSSGSFSIDGVLPTDFIYSGLGEERAEPQFNQLLFKTPKLTSGPHSLTVTHAGPNAPLTLSYVIVENVRDGPGPFTTNTTPPPSSDGSETPDSQVGATTSSTNAGAVAGGVIGGLCGLGLLSFLVYLFIRWRRRTQLPMIQPLPGFVKPENTAPLEIDLVNIRRSDELFPPSRPGSYGFQHTRRRSNARRFNPEVRSTISSVHLNPPPVQHAPPSTTNTGYDNDSIAEVERPTASNDTRGEDLNPYAAGYPYAAMPLSDYQNLVQATKHQEARAKANQQRDSYM